ncbi:protein-L-isoaspartate(D-aspartate) O-methyltransferase [Aeromonas simiae]|uniref:protein-L-isoaspartate(D-aspartate) O-methyltransferase n=1 Tax=Aeromonas simiae TaxID=218936 RepID=UPI0005A8EC99|nr:protein-L-isoaspartate(D-aspartate) O-methyltransferase [Aeromonas simiae]MDO2950050.1 protein-L-isoaspartate(D-aspartate) O-methyltransferase [Aeromonas simiae]MDO2953738.1 protein-L-isoaspartate(D-aspartate) O-methyltransferase [Aeromonas simiae]MDO2957431.1 protein-L-isoaspartate(D-aspartate) O-methyltransferase [Aeromonas simiae]
MIEQRLLNQLIAKGISDYRVLAAIAEIPRDYFVDEAMAHQAWDNTALPIGHGQTISQPYMVARMTELVVEHDPAHVLEIGTGSGYQTAILARLVQHVYTVERIKSLQYQARRRLRNLELHNISTKHGNGWEGWASKGPFDAILVTAAASEVPQALTDQLAEGGRLVIPVGDAQQSLMLVERSGSQLIRRALEPVRFVPLVNGDLE